MTYYILSNEPHTPTHTCVSLSAAVEKALTLHASQSGIVFVFDENDRLVAYVGEP